MHELSLVERLIDMMEQTAREHSFHRVRGIHLEVGSLAGVEVDALRLALDLATPRTLAEGAAIHIETPTGTARCQACEREIELTSLHEPCPHCGSHRLKITGGDCLLLKHLEVE